MNYRWAKLYGNYEGLYRNDNGQSDPSISSLFDFSNGVLACWVTSLCRLPEYGSETSRQSLRLYSIPNGFMKRFTGGIGLRGSSGNRSANSVRILYTRMPAKFLSAAVEVSEPSLPTINLICMPITLCNWVSGISSSSPLIPST